MDLQPEILAVIGVLTVALVEAAKKFPWLKDRAHWYAPLSVGFALLVAGPVLYVMGVAENDGKAMFCLWFLYALYAGVGGAGLYSTVGKHVAGAVSSIARNKLLLLGLCATTAMAGYGCGLSDGQRFKLASSTYQATTRTVTTAVQAGMFTDDELVTIQDVDNECYDVLSRMETALVEGRPLDFEFAHQAANRLIDRMIAMELTAGRRERQKKELIQ